jgi:uncharacterized protein YndB with AHSA1/START domain
MTTQDTIEREIAIAAPPERVWEVLTRAEHLGAWFGDAGAEIDLRPGGAMTLTWSEHGTSNARVERVDPPRFFSYRWALAREEPVRAGRSTLVEFTLEPAGDGTLVRVVESGFAALELSAQEQARQHAGNTEGWEIKLGDLRDHLAGHAVR